MIVEWFFDLMEGFVTWFFSLFDGIQIPSWLQQPPVELTEFMSSIGSMGVWVPWPVALTVLGSVVTVYVAAFLVKLVKQILSHVPAFGGAG